MGWRWSRSRHFKDAGHFEKCCSPPPSGRSRRGHSVGVQGSQLRFSKMGWRWLRRGHFTDAHLNASRHTPLRQGDQVFCIPWLLGVDDCDSQRWAGGDWGSGIWKMRVGTHQHTPLRQGDQGSCIPQLLGVDDRYSQRWTGGDLEGGIWGMRVRKHCDTPHRQGDREWRIRRLLEFDLCSFLRRDQRVRVRGVDAALVESRGPQEVPEHVLLFSTIQYSGAFGSCTINNMAEQHSQNAWSHSFHLPQGVECLFLFHGFHAFFLWRFDNVGACHLEIENWGANWR